MNGRPRHYMTSSVFVIEEYCHMCRRTCSRSPQAAATQRTIIELLLFSAPTRASLEEIHKITEAYSGRASRHVTYIHAASLAHAGDAISPESSFSISRTFQRGVLMAAYFQRSAPAPHRTVGRHVFSTRMPRC